MKTYRKNPMYMYLLLLAVFSTIGFQGWRTMLTNFAENIVHINGFEMGIIQSVREIPGFLTFLVVFVLLFVKEHKLSAYSVIVLGIGTMMVGFLPSLEGLILSTVIMSLGFHYFETANSSLTLQYFNKHDSALVFSHIRSIISLTNIIVGVCIFLLYWLLQDFSFRYQLLFALVGGISVIGAIWALNHDPVDHSLPHQKKRIVLKKKYWLFYVLNFLSGARRQIFVVFALFLLVKKYDYEVWHIAGLFVVNNIIGYFFNPVIGKSINRFGERIVLSVEYFLLIFIFLAYAYWESFWGVALLYIIDNMVFNFSVAIKTYLRHIADPEDIAPSNSAGFAINHISAVIIPLIGGILWMKNWQLPFIVAAGLSLLSLLFVQKITVPKTTQTHGS